MNRAVALLRVSTPRQAAEGYSMEDQERAIRSYLTQRSLVLTELVREDGVSGRQSERAALQRVLALAEAGAFDVLVCVKLDRLGRNNRTIQITLHALESRGIRVEFVDYQFTNDMTGRFVRNVMGSVAELESDQIRERTMAGRRAKAEQGRIPAYLQPYGYHQIRKYEALAHPHYAGRDGELEIVESQAAVVREIYRRFAAGDSLYQLGRWLTEAGIRTARGKDWSPSVIRGILESTVYTGTIYYYRRIWRSSDEQLTANGKPKSWGTPRDREEQTAIPVPRIVDQDIWERAQARLRDQKDAFRGRETYNYLLRGLVRCGLCHRADGRPLTCSGERRGSSGRVYMCASRSIASREWCGTFYSARSLEASAQAHLRQMAEGDAIQQLIANRLEGLRQTQRASAPNADKLARDLEAVNAKLKRLIEQSLEFDFPRDVVAAQNAKLCAERETIKAEMRRLHSMEDLLAQTADQLLQVPRIQAELRERIAAAEGDSVEWVRLFRGTMRVVLRKGRNPQWSLQDAFLGF